MIRASDIPARSSFRLVNGSVPGCLLEPASTNELVRVDIDVADGHIASVRPAGTTAPAPDSVDLDRSMVWPGLIDVHTHLDKGHIWPRTQNPDGTFMGALTAAAEDRRRYWTAEDVARRMDFSLRCAYTHGTVAIRTHLNSEPPQDAISWPVFCNLRRRWAGRIHLQPVCLIALEKLVEPLATELADLVAQSDGVLGVMTDASPTLDTDLRRVFRLARERGLDLDFHADESLNPESRSLDRIADLALDFPGKVHAGHCCSLSVQADKIVAATLRKLKAAGVSISSQPMCNLYLQDRQPQRTPRLRGVTLLHEMRACGIAAALASDNTRDPFYGYGEPLAELRVRVGFSFSVSSAGQALGLIGGHWGRFLILLSCQTTESGGTTPMALREILSSYWSCFQALLFPQLEETIGALGERHQRFVMVLEWVRVETLLPYQHRRRGCPPSDRAALARAFIAKAVFALVSTRMLLDRLRHDSTLRRLCGWRSVKHIPSEATFSRAFAEFADSALPSHLHEALIKRTQGERLAGHISRDSTAIEGRERPTPKAPQPAKPKRRRGRPRKGEERPTEPRRLERQRNMTLPEMLADLPYACDIGVKRDAKGYQTSWSGYKLHIDAADGAIPVSCLLTSASLHDSQVAIPLATLTAERVRNLYDLMDSAYDAPEIRAHSRALGHVAIIDVNPRSGARKQALRQERQARRACGLVLSEERRYHERSTVERVNGRLKDEFGGRSVRVRGHAKVLCHLMFGIVALTVDQLMRLVT